MSVVHALVIAPCLLPSNGSELIGIKKCKNIMYHLQEPLATTELTCYVLYEWSMAETNIYSIEWELRWWFSACHCERNVSLYDARCTITKSLIFFYLLHTTINRWNTLRNLHDDICLNKHIYYIMSGRYNKLHFCNVAVWTKVCTDHKWKLSDIFQLHTTINLTPTLSVRWEIIDGRLRSSCADNA